MYTHHVHIHTNEHLAKVMNISSVYNVSRNVWSRNVLQIQSLRNTHKLPTFRFVQYGNVNETPNHPGANASVGVIYIYFQRHIYVLTLYSGRGLFLCLLNRVHRSICMPFGAGSCVVIVYLFEGGCGEVWLDYMYTLC